MIIENTKEIKVIFEIISVSKQDRVEMPKVERSKTAFELLNPPRPDGFPKVKEIGFRGFVKGNAKDPNYNLPLSNLYKSY